MIFKSFFNNNKWPESGSGFDKSVSCADNANEKKRG